MKLFPSVNSRDDVVEYEGGRTSVEIVTWLKEKLAENVPPPEIFEIVDHASLNAHCEDRQLCIVAVLPHILDCQSECRNNYLQIMKDMGEKYKRNIWGWLWAEAGAQPALEDSVEVGGFGYPTMVAISPRKMMYSTLMGPFSETGIDDFFRNIATRRVSSAPLKGAQFPKLETIDPWDGNDREEGIYILLFKVPADEDLDLSDVVLDDLKDEL
ncbi:hypothetical protein ACJMK2_004530 [Sinanodonta woodiana]|uniref:protein disulfide-isomerase n=1 Tax=Sinanodonta woodiana TaxID=1069815 RepID=A0ABD3Y1K2_SINWO